jgi:hypothetical protein
MPRLLSVLGACFALALAAACSEEGPFGRAKPAASGSPLLLPGSGSGGGSTGGPGGTAASPFPVPSGASPSPGLLARDKPIADRPAANATPAVFDQTDTTGGPDAALENTVFDLINVARAASGSTTLPLEPPLRTAARVHAKLSAESATPSFDPSRSGYFGSATRATVAFALGTGESPGAAFAQKLVTQLGGAFPPGAARSMAIGIAHVGALYTVTAMAGHSAASLSGLAVGDGPRGTYTLSGKSTALVTAPRMTSILATTGGSRGFAATVASDGTAMILADIPRFGIYKVEFVALFANGTTEAVGTMYVDGTTSAARAIRPTAEAQGKDRPWPVL